MSAMPVLTIALLACLVPVAILAGGAVIGLAHAGRNLLRRPGRLTFRGIAAAPSLGILGTRAAWRPRSKTVHRGRDEFELAGGRKTGCWGPLPGPRGLRRRGRW